MPTSSAAALHSPPSLPSLTLLSLNLHARVVKIPGWKKPF